MRNKYELFLANIRICRGEYSQKHALYTNQGSHDPHNKNQLKKKREGKSRLTSYNRLKAWAKKPTFSGAVKI